MNDCAGMTGKPQVIRFKMGAGFYQHGNSCRNQAITLKFTVWVFVATSDERQRESVRRAQLGIRERQARKLRYESPSTFPRLPAEFSTECTSILLSDETRWNEKAGLRGDAVGSQVIDVLKAQEIKETGNEKD